MIPQAPRPRPLRQQLSRFVLVGLGVAALDFAVFMLFITLQVPRGWANVAGMTAGFGAGLVGHHRFTFQPGGPLAWRVAVRYALGFALNLALGGLTLEVLVRFGASEPAAKLVAMGVVVASNFVLSRQFVFRRH